MSEREQSSAAVALLRERLASGRLLPVRRALHALNPAEIANLLESLPPRQRSVVWEMVSPEDDGEVLLHLGDDVRTALMRQIDVNELVAAAEEPDIDDAAGFGAHLPDTATRQAPKTRDAVALARPEAALPRRPAPRGRP